MPALLLGLAVRVVLLLALPYALWGADSRSHFSFAHQLLVRHAISLDEKRRYLVPLLLAPAALLPGATLRWVALGQHGLGLVSLAAFAYAIRRTLIFWRAWLIPLTGLYAVFPITLLFEHQLIGECLFFNLFLWAVAGWCAWTGASGKAATSRFWLFFLPWAAFSLTKASARFAWPGLALALALAAWEGRVRLSLRQGAALLGLAALTLTAGSSRQGA